MSASNLFAARLAACAVALALFSPRAANATDDAGTRSVFATGAGARALALGGAFAAIADDASASLWNPGGLGGIPQGQVQFSQSEMELGFHETFAGVVLPDWRFGAAALTLRHFGTDGIEARDGRNTVVGTNLADRESEIGLGVGGTVGSAWSIGAAAKLRRQDLAGRSGTGVGLDLGMRVAPAVALHVDRPWAQQLQIGLALRNALEPAIRLDQESVQDPSELRLGLAFARPAFGLGSVLMSVDVEKTSNVGTHLHAGLEVEPHPMLALRAGLNNGTLTAGTAVRFHDADLEYTFEDQAIGPTHRAGITYHFGATVDEARDRAARAEEDRINARLAEVERKREAERLDALLDRAEEARVSGDRDEAARLVATARVIDPEYPRARSLEVLLLRERGRSLLDAGDPAGAAVVYRQALVLAPGDTALTAALERSRHESDVRAARTAEVRRRFNAAMDAFVSDDLAAARSGFTAILAANPKDAEARTMLARVNTTIARRVEDLLRGAELLLQAGDLKEAEATLARARALDSDAPGLDALAAAIEKQKAAAGHERRPAAAAGSTPRPATTPALTRDQQRDVAEFYKRGQRAFEAGRADEALRYWELVWSIQPGYLHVDEYLKREYQTRGMEHFAAGRLREAVSMWERALRVDPKDQRTLGYLARAHEQLDRARAISGEEP